jgi:hypothetical protein
MVQARLFQINKGLLGQQSFLPINFDREYTCLTMCTIHSTLIDYRFRQTMAPKRKNVAPITEDFENISMPKIDEIIMEEEQSFTMNGILVESKFDSPEDKKMQKSRLIKGYLQKQSSWLTNNMMEFLFFSESG